MLVFDIGNSDSVVGVFKGENIVNIFRIRSLKEENEVYFEYKLLNFLLENDIDKSNFKSVVISSVVPELTPIFVGFCQKHLNLNPIVVNPSQSNKLKVKIEHPEELGSDLFVNALAAHSFFKRNCIVVDFGTALTFTAVSAKGEILGVAILPGIKTAIKSLFSQTSLLPEIKLEKPESVIGKTTLQAIQSGIFYGYEGVVQNIVSRMKSEIGEDCACIATGGLSAVLSKDLSKFFDKIDKELTLKGLYLYGQLTNSIS